MRLSAVAEAGQRASVPNNKALYLAWAVEVVAVGMGLLLAAYAGFEGSDAGFFAGAVALIPFAALSIIELTKIPLVGLSFQVKAFKWKVLAFAALLVVTVATYENFIFGFERGFNERLRTVENSEQAVRVQENASKLAETRIPHLTELQTDLTNRLTALREEVDGIHRQAQQDIADSRATDMSNTYRSDRERLDSEITRLSRERDANVERERRRCSPNVRCSPTTVLNTYNGRINDVQREIEALNERQRSERDTAQNDVAAARAKRDADLELREAQRNGLQQQLETVRSQLSEARQTVLLSEEKVATASRHRDEMIEKSQIHRLAMVLYGKQDRATVEETKRLFVMSLAAIVAIIGTVLATMHYAALHSREPVRQPIANAIRGYLARRRRSIPVLTDLREAVRQRHGIARNVRGWTARRRRTTMPVHVKIVEKEVLVDRLKLVFIPLNATEEEIMAARREAAKEAA